MSNTTKILSFLIDATTRADKECSTVEACNELHARAKKLLKGSPIRDEVLSLLQWEPFTSKKPEKRKFSSFVPQQWMHSAPPPLPVMQGSTLGAPQQQQLQSFAPAYSRARFCTFCGLGGHVENTCFRKNPQLKK